MKTPTIGFDADDTLWHSENHFAVTEERFRRLLAPWTPPDTAGELLVERERANLKIFGYGVKGFTLSMIETAIEISDGQVPAEAVQQLIDWGKELLGHPVELIDGAQDVLTTLGEDHRLVLITKGDLFHQESKVAESGLADHFDSVEILSEKSPESYAGVLDRLGVKPSEFVMIGNSVRSDILPVLNLGGRAIHVPYGITWSHEQVEAAEETHNWETIGSLPELLTMFSPGAR